MPRVSVIIPTYNRLELVQDAIDSVLAQSYKDFELIVVDDGSSDGSEKLIKKYPKIKFLTQENRGVSAARNLGIVNSCTEYIAFLDSDDLWHKDKLKIQLDYHDKTPDIKISYTDEKWIRDGKTINKPLKYRGKEDVTIDDLLKYTFIATSSLIVHKDIFSSIGLYDETLLVCEDFDLFLRIRDGYKIGFINKSLNTKRAGHQQLSNEHILDYYRVKSLIKNRSFSPDKIDKIIQSKITFLYNGARKHHNYDLINKLLTL